MTRIEQLRRDKGWLLLEFSVASGVTVRTLGALERREKDRCAQDRIQKAVATALGVRVATVFTADGKPKEGRAR